MANPAGYMNTYSQQPAVDGVGYPGSIPNGQPPQFPRPPMYPQKAAPPRPLMVGQQPNFPPGQAASNGQNSHTSSLSSHSSRNPSPIPPRPNDNGLSSSTPNLTNVPLSSASHAPNNPPMHSANPQPPMNAGIPKVSSSPYMGLTGSASGPQRPNFVQHSTQSLVNVSQTSTMAASHQNLGPIRYQMPPRQTNVQSGPGQPQIFPSLTNSSQGQPPSSQASLIRPELPPNMSSNTTSAQFGMDRQPFPPSVNQMPFNSPQPPPSYQAGFIRPQMPPNTPQVPSNQQIGPPRQGAPTSQPGMAPPSTFMNIRAPGQLPPTSNFGQVNQVYNNPNIPPKSVLNARYPEASIAPSGMTSQQPSMTASTTPQQTLAAQPPGPRMTIAQNRYPQNPAATRPPFGMEPPPSTGMQNAYPGAPPMSRPPGPGMVSGPVMGPPPQSQNTPGMPTNKPQHPMDASLKGTLPASRQESAGPYSFNNAPGSGPPGTVQSSTGYSQSGAAPPIGASPSNQPRSDGTGHLGKRYPTQPQAPYTNQIQPSMDTTGLNNQMGSMSITQQGFQKLWGANSYDLLQHRNILPQEKVETPKVKLHQEFLDSVNCSPEIFRCTMTKIPETSALLQKSRLPLGILIHPFKDLNEYSLEELGDDASQDEKYESDLSIPSFKANNKFHVFSSKHLAVIQCSSIVRCRACRTYINPFVYFVDHKRWKCNLCFRVNELPEEFQFDPVSKTYGDPTRRPEIKSATIEFIAPSEYMLRPPQPAVYLFVLDVSRLGVECGYLRLFCQTLMEELDRLPGDSRTQVGFITFDSTVHFYNLAEGLNQPQQMIVVDVDDIFLPVPDSLIVNLHESKDLIRDLLNQLPQKFQDSHDTHSALGAALQAAYKLMVRGQECQPQPDLQVIESCSRVPYYKYCKAPTGGRVTVFQSCLPNFGPGALQCREDPTLRAGKEAPHLNPATDFYKRLALDCSGQQIAVDLFIVNSQYCDLATLSGVSRFSGGCIHHIPLFKASSPQHTEKLQQSFKRYLSRKLGMEAVMRIRCSRGLSIHTFHGNFFVRSTDLLSLPNINPDAGFGMQVAIEENLSDLQNVCFQAALLYTSTKGERRIRVHTMCLPVSANLGDVIHAADQQCIIGLLAKMGVDRSHQSSLSDARDAFINVAIDSLSAYRLAQSSSSTSALLVPHNLRLLPLYILALLKYVAFRTGQSTRLDDRLFAMCQLKTLPLTGLIQEIYPDLYPIHNLIDQDEIDVEGTIVPQPPRLQLTSEKLEISGAYILDASDNMIIFIGRNINSMFCQAVFGVPAFNQISEDILELPELDTPESDRLRRFVSHLQSEKPYPATIQLIRDDSQTRVKFYERLIEDRTESALSYYEFLQHLKTNIK